MTLILGHAQQRLLLARSNIWRDAFEARLLPGGLLMLYFSGLTSMWAAVADAAERSRQPQIDLQMDRRPIEQR